MKSVTTRQFQLNQSKYLKELPIVLTHYGKRVALITKYIKSVNTFKANSKRMSGVFNKFHHLCKHGSMKGLCKKGC